jgi:voltage-gated potassium channel
MATTPRTDGERLGPFQLVLAVLSILVLGALVAEIFFTLPAEVARIFHGVDLIVCIVFFVDFAIRFRAAPSKVQFMKWGWIDLVASIPVIGHFRWGRAVRLFRIIRLLRGMGTVRHILAMLFAHRARSGVASVALISFLVITFASVTILFCEQAPESNIHTAEDAVWWSMSTITTVGYGDRFPVTTLGRIVACCVMVIGVGLFGTLSGLIASLFVGESEEKIETTESEILTEIRALRAEVAELRAAQAKPPAPPS